MTGAIRYHMRLDALPPRRAYKGDAGLDLFVPMESWVWVKPGCGTRISVKVSFEIPEGVFGLILPRSSVAASGLTVQPSVIDSGYHGDVSVLVHNGTSRAVELEGGMSLAQIVFIPLSGLPVISAASGKELEPSKGDRQGRGFGSSDMEE